MSIYCKEEGWEGSRNFEKNVLKALRLSFILLSSIAAVYTLYQIFFISTFEQSMREQRSIRTSSKQNLKADDPVLIPQLKPARSFEEYASQIQGRKIFQSPLEREKAQMSSLAVNVSEVTKNLKLTGIVLDKDPQAIIKDVQMNQNVFVHRGDQINGAVVEDILEGKVILNVQNQRVELLQ